MKLLEIILKTTGFYLLQIVPLPKNPGLHEQSKLPSVFTHWAFSSQTSLLDSHSLMSEGKHIVLDKLLIIIFLNFHNPREHLEHLYSNNFKIHYSISDTDQCS